MMHRMAIGHRGLAIRPPAEAQHSAPHDRAAPDAAPLLLLAEDDADLRDALRDLLDEEGYRTLVVSDGLQAMQRARVEGPAAAVVDVNLPGAGGRAVAEELLRSRPHMRVVLMSGDGEVEVPRAAILLQKPFPAERLLGALRGC